MFLSGARIGMVLIQARRKQTPQDLRLVRPVCCAAATGAATPTTVARRGAEATSPLMSSSTSASVSRGLRRTSPQPSLRKSPFTLADSAKRSLLQFLFLLEGCGLSNPLAVEIF